jgi:hypothetical protein
MHGERADAARGDRDQHPAERRIDDGIADFRATSPRPPNGGDDCGDYRLVHDGLGVCFLIFLLYSISIAYKSLNPQAGVL